MSNIIASFTGDYEFLSNFYPCQIKDNVNNIVFPTAEHFYQSRKTNNILEKLRFVELTAGQAKRCGQKVTLRRDWETVKIFEMGVVLGAKFNQNENLKRLLIATDGVPLIEGNQWHDKFWGKCYCMTCQGEGDNWLGKLLVYLRYSFINHPYKVKPFSFDY